MISFKLPYRILNSEPLYHEMPENLLKPQKGKSNTFCMDSLFSDCDITVIGTKIDREKYSSIAKVL